MLLRKRDRRVKTSCCLHNNLVSKCFCHCITRSNLGKLRALISESSVTRMQRHFLFYRFCISNVNWSTNILSLRKSYYFVSLENALESLLFFFFFAFLVFFSLRSSLFLDELVYHLLKFDIFECFIISSIGFRHHFLIRYDNSFFEIWNTHLRFFLRWG